MQLLIPTESFAGSALWYYPACFLYHMMYMTSLTKEYDTYLHGPKLYTKDKVRKHFPDASQVHGKWGVIMHEAQMIDSRMNLNTLFTSSIDGFIPGMKGANLANYTEFLDFSKDAEGKIVGAKLKDGISGKEFTVKAKCVVNCAGVHSDNLRIKDNENAEKRIQGARGTHVMFKKGLLPADAGILIPKTKDGRVLFICSYFGHPMVGTTDLKCDVTHHCEPTQEEIDYIFQELRPYFGADYDYKNNMLSAWAGIRPLVKESQPSEADLKRLEQEWLAMGFYDKFKHYMKEGVRTVAKTANFSNTKSSGTAKLSRSHAIEVSDSGLVSLLGGKWTSFREMGQECVEAILERHKNIEPVHDSVQTGNFNLIGSYSRAEAITGMKPATSVLYGQYKDHFAVNYDLPHDVIDHLIHAYGTTSLRVVELGEKNKTNKIGGANKRIH